MLRPCSWYVSTLLVVCFDYARGMFQPYSWHNLTVLEICRLSSDNLTLLDRVTIVLVVDFHCARDMFRLCSGYVSTVLVVCFDHARGKFWPWSIYVSVNLKINITHARGRFQSLSS